MRCSYSYTEHLPSWVLPLLSSQVAMNRDSRQLQVPVDSQETAAYVPCSFLKVILAVQPACFQDEDCHEEFSKNTLSSLLIDSFLQGQV